MKLERLHEYILPVVATLAGMGVAAYCGKLTGNGQIGTLAFIIAMSVATTLVLLLRQHIWILIPVGWVLYGQIPVLPLPFSIRDLTVMTVFVAFLALIALKIVRTRPKWDFTDLVAALLVVYMVTVFLRNPVGVNALGSERVGGRPYFDIVIGVMAYWVLARATADARLTAALPFFVLAAQVFEMALNVMAVRFPQTAPILAAVYNGIDPSKYEAEDVWDKVPGAPPTSGRQAYLLGFGQAIALVCCSFWRPLTLLIPIYWFRFVCFSGALVLIGFSGFRSGLLMVAGYAFVSSIVRRGKKEIFPLVLLAVPALAFLIAIQGTFVELPMPIQRALSFLPGRWDPSAVRDARDSTAWRLAIWKIMLTEEQFVESRWLGDGFGFSQRQLAVMRSKRVYGGEKLDDVIIIGNVHSGPLSTIRYAGYVGLAIYLTLTILVARKAWAVVQRAKNTPLFTVAMFISIPLIFHPFAYVFIIGGFEGAVPATLFGLGLVKMLENSLDRRGMVAGDERRLLNKRSIQPREADAPLVPA